MIRLYIICSAFLVPVPSQPFYTLSAQYFYMKYIHYFFTLSAQYFYAKCPYHRSIGALPTQTSTLQCPFGPLKLQLCDFGTQLLLPSAVMTSLFVPANSVWPMPQAMDRVLASRQCVCTDHFIHYIFYTSYTFTRKMYFMNGISVHYLLSFSCHRRPSRGGAE